MCGIVGYAGRAQAAPVLLDGLARLEYRGYDSAGAVVVNGAGLQLCKAEGRLRELRQRLERHWPEGSVGIGHTRWATHGSPSYANAHPHTDCSETIAVVHNGIIENYRQLRRDLEARGHRFRSETDTEVIPHLIEEYYRGDLVEAVRRAVAKLEGSYALAVVSAKEPDRVVACRKDSPLIVGFGTNEQFLASDIPALLPYTREVCPLEDGEMAVLTASGVALMNDRGERVERKPMYVNWDTAAAERSGYEHFMRKEIDEQPRALRDTLRGCLQPAKGGLFPAGVRLEPADVRRLERVVILGMGTARHAGLVGRFAMARLAGIPAEVELASEFRYDEPLLAENTLAVVISQSGETADTLAGAREARRRGARVLAVTNVVGSSLARDADDVVYTLAGPEIAVASTKAYVAQLMALYVLAAWMGRVRGHLDEDAYAEVHRQLEELPETVEKVLALEEEVKAQAERLASADHVFFMGRGLDYAVAAEGALKLKEVSYVHAEAYSAGELKHGTLALIEEGVPVVAIATQPHLFDKMASNMREVAARGARVWAVVAPEMPDPEACAREVLTLPSVPPLFAPVVAAVPLQLLAYHVGRVRGCDIDKPRNLAKSVTVE